MPFLGHVLVIVCVALFVAAQGEYCQLIRDYYQEVEAFPRVLSWRGQERKLVLHCGSAPSCAAAALLHAVLVHTLAYRQVTLRPGPHRLHTFAAGQGNSTDWNYPEIIVDLSSSWRPSDETVPNEIIGIGGLAGPRFQEFGLSTVPARRQLLARLSAAATRRAACSPSHRYTFYANHSLLEICNFLRNSKDEKAVLYVVKDTFLYEIPDNANVYNELVTDLKNRVIATGLLLNVVNITRKDLEKLMLQDISLLFLDFNLYVNTTVVAVQPPPCSNPHSKCDQDLDSSVALRIADVLTLRTSSPELLELLYKFSPPIQYLREVAKLEASVKDKAVEQASCQWIINNNDQVDEWRYSIFKKYYVVIFICREDFTAEPYNNTIIKIGEYITEMKAADSRFDFDIFAEPVDCLDENQMRTVLWTNYLRMTHLYHLLGVLVPGSVGAVSMSALAGDYDVPTLAYDALSPRSVPHAWLLAPLRLRAAGLGHFVRACGWTRLAVLSEPTKTANDFIETLENEDGFVIGKFYLPLAVSKGSIINSLLDLRRNNSRIIFVNANSLIVSDVLREARNLNMDAEDEYTWIVRDWHQNETFPLVTYYTVSPYGQPRVKASNLELQKEVEQDERGAMSWPMDTQGPWPTRHGSTIVDGLWMLAQSFEEVWRQRPGARNDLRNGQTISALEAALSRKPVRGIFEQLRFEGRELTASWMYAEKWRNRQSELLATWRVGKRQHGIKIKPIANPTHDGDITCILRRGNPFYPACLDSAWATGLALLTVVPLAALLAVRHAKLYLKRRDDALHKKFLANRDRCSAELCGWHVSRSDLEIVGYLGAGHFGRVNLGRLRTNEGVFRSVAVKQLHEGASTLEESEFLREACMLASLSHEHVVRLVGVCDDEGPPLLLTEVALFGDLLGYLSARRHLAEGGAAQDEAEHVSAAALTRLAREAAAAVQHLATRGVVHRDVRAANCLVDERRALKLADFGMARRTAEYVCMRRAVVPVRWMAPEAVARGAFSAASDVWALGVLLLELMTLGSRPWGAAPPDRVVRLVAAGERPPMPRDASPPARALTALCWADVADRPSADQVRAYLERHPRALRPALAGPEHSDSDSGYIENPYSMTSTSESITTKSSYFLSSSMEEATLEY